jgi:hypothetical protein
MLVALGHARSRHPMLADCRLLTQTNARHAPACGIYRQHHPRPAALWANFIHRIVTAIPA